MQKKANLHYTLSLDLFGSEISTNAANAYSAGIKGRFHEDMIDDDHRLLDATYPTLRLVNGQPAWSDEPALKTLNMRLRDDYTVDCERGLARWNKTIAETGIDFRFTLPHVAFNRAFGEFANVDTDPQGNVIDGESFARSRGEWLPSDDDGEYIKSLMKPETEVGKFANWISPPRVGINKLPGEYEYVKIQ